MLLHFNVKPILVFDGCNLPSKAGQEERRRKYVPLSLDICKSLFDCRNFFSVRELPSVLRGSFPWKIGVLSDVVRTQPLYEINIFSLYHINFPED